MIDYFLMVIYIIMLLIHLLMIIKKKKSKPIVIATFILLFFLMSGHRYKGDGDAIDFLAYYDGYYNIYNEIKRDFWFYYLFYSTQFVSYQIGLNYYLWLSVMTAISLFLIYKLVKKFDYNFHIFFAFFMTYYVFLFYGGLKFYYGFVLFSYSLSYFIRNKPGDKGKSFMFLMFAGSFHIMYYMFILMYVINMKKSKLIIRIILLSSLLLTLLIIGSSGFGFIQKLINQADNNRISLYFRVKTNLGWVLPVTIHILISTYTLIINKGVYNRYGAMSLEYKRTNRLMQTTILLAAFYPLFVIALTFMRILTSYSMIMFLISGYYALRINKNHKYKVLTVSIATILMFYFINLYLNGYWDKTFRPMFDIFLIIIHK